MTDTLTKTAFFPTSPETVWAFLTEKDKMGEWYHAPQSDLVEGEPYEMMMKSDDGSDMRGIWGRVLLADRPARLSYTFCIPPFGDAETTVEITLEAAHGGTRLTLVHTGIADASGEAALGLLMALDHGWDEHLQKLRVATKSD